MANYINNKEFEDLVNEYLKNKSKENEKLLFEMFGILIDHIMYSFNFQVDHEDAKQDCYLLIVKILPNFDSSNGSAFNYFTTVIINNLRLIYSKNKVYEEKLEKYFTTKEHLKDLLDIAN